MSTADQARALSQTAGVRTRDDLVLVRVSGDDRVSWLNGQVTSDVRDMTHGVGVYALAVTVRGKIMGDLWVLDRGEHLAVLLPKSVQAVVLESFERQIIMEDVALTPDPTMRVVSVQGPRAHDVVADEADIEAHRCDELGHGGLFVLLREAEIGKRLPGLIARAAQVGGGAVDDAGFELARLRAGRGRMGLDFDEHHYPQEAGLKRLAVSFEKGCYLGQEVVCTLENRGRLTRRLMRLEALPGAAPARGSELHDADGHAVGLLTSVVTDPDTGRALALGYVKQAAAALGQELRAGECMLRVGAPAGAD